MKYLAWSILVAVAGSAVYACTVDPLKFAITGLVFAPIGWAMSKVLR